VLPSGIAYGWTDLAYQDILSGHTMALVFPLCVLLVFLVLAAQYESWTLPLAVILIVPMSILCALVGVKLTNGDNNVFTQIALFVLVGSLRKTPFLSLNSRASWKNMVELFCRPRWKHAV
jgi:multidrug efflux pump